ncbi:hypothetical protein BHM03_00059753 [Ensete ventricosum]|nr:hypothetical protein BHM03_00059753 [Ensete ventricosum]
MRASICPQVVTREHYAHMCYLLSRPLRRVVPTGGPCSCRPPLHGAWPRVATPTSSQPTGGRPWPIGSECYLHYQSLLQMRRTVLCEALVTNSCYAACCPRHSPCRCRNNYCCSPLTTSIARATVVSQPLLAPVVALGCVQQRRRYCFPPTPAVASVVAAHPSILQRRRFCYVAISLLSHGSTGYGSTSVFFCTRMVSLSPHSSCDALLLCARVMCTIVAALPRRFTSGPLSRGCYVRRWSFLPAMTPFSSQLLLPLSVAPSCC